MGIDASKLHRTGVFPHFMLLFRTVDDANRFPPDFPQTIYSETNHWTSERALGRSRRF